MVLDIVLLAFSLGLILLASVLFTNAIEMLGHRLKIHQGAVGSILAAVGTALPETVIPIIAIFWVGDAGAKDVAVGAIAGAPFMLATVAFFVTGAAVVIYGLTGRRSRKLNADTRVVSRDLTFFIILYAVAVATTFFHESMAVRIPVAVALVLAYGWYIKVTFSSEAEGMEETDHLYFSKVTRLAPGLTLTWIQLIGALAIMIAGGDMFVKYVETLADIAKVPALILSLILTPIATELPEKFNSVIWIRRRKDTLAIGNITGAMVFQCSFPVAFGIVGTPWDLCENHYVTLLSAGLALASAALVLIWIRVKKNLPPAVLMVGGLLYLVFFGYILMHMR